MYSFSSFRWFKKDCCQIQAKYVHKVLVNYLVKHALEKVELGELTISTQTNEQNLLILQGSHRLERYLKIEGFLEKSWKLNLSWKVMVVYYFL